MEGSLTGCCIRLAVLSLGGVTGGGPMNNSSASVEEAAVAAAVAAGADEGDAVMVVAAVTAAAAAAVSAEINIWVVAMEKGSDAAFSLRAKACGGDVVS